MVATADSFSYAGIDLAGSDYNVFVRDWDDFPEMPEPRLNAEPLSQAHGDVTQGATYEAIVATLKCNIIFCAGVADRDTKIAAIGVVFANTLLGEQEFILGHRPTEKYYARIVGKFAPLKYINGADFDVTLHISNPIPETV